MRSHAIDPSTGLFSGHSFFTDENDEEKALISVKQNTPAGRIHFIHEGSIDYLSRKVDLSTGTIVLYQPPQPSEHHEWDTATERWVINDARQKRMQAHSDALNKITQLEQLQPRYIREHTLGINPKALERLQAIENEIVELRKSIMQELMV